MPFVPQKKWTNWIKFFAKQKTRKTLKICLIWQKAIVFFFNMTEFLNKRLLTRMHSLELNISFLAFKWYFRLPRTKKRTQKIFYIKMNTYLECTQCGVNSSWRSQWLSEHLPFYKIKLTRHEYIECNGKSHMPKSFAFLAENLHLY